MNKICVIQLSGSPYQMGYAHGERFRDEIRVFTEERVRLCRSIEWTGRELSREAVIALAEACVAEHQAYAPDLMEEARGIADAADLTLAELVINNGFTDFIDTIFNLGDVTMPALAPSLAADNCTAFMVPASRSAGGQAYFGQTWDMHATATPYVILLRGQPNEAPDFLTFTVTGCVGMIGMNSAGIAVGVNNLMATDGQIGVTWPFVVRKILQQQDLDGALACLTEAKLAGAHNYMLMDGKGRGYEVEAMSTTQHVHELGQETISHTNHCLIQKNLDVARERPPDSQNSSENRLRRARELLANDGITIDDLMALTRDEVAICTRPQPPAHVESCGAAIMRPATGDFWSVWGIPADNEYEHFVI
ncbi:MAG: C45 family autoproteolytic acyltransferase/hydrolase [Chloroflexi bacterium]|nr:C45 family autoproteolytic acyltransferase/hydrolase [Chloroflexota bacterium]